MEPVHKQNKSWKDGPPPPPPTFHEAIQQFMNPPNPKTKPSLPIFRKRSKKRDPRLEKPEFEFSKEFFVQPNQSPRRFDGSPILLQFKSPAVYCEVKLLEMLSKAKEPREKAETPGKYPEAPDAFRTSVCCQILAEICNLATPFTKVLCIIHNELEQAIYSNYVTPSTTTIFEQVPYFELVSNLEQKNSDVVAEQEKSKVLLSEIQVEIHKKEMQIQELKGQIAIEHAMVDDLQKNLSSTLRDLEKSNKEVTRLMDQVAKSRQEVLHAREVEHELEEADSRYESLMAKHVTIVHELQHYQSNLEAARKEAADGIPKKEMAIAKAQIKELQHKLMKLENLTEQMGTMTPRPHWALLRGGSYYTMSTAEQASEICKLNDLLLENITTLRLECATAQVALAEMKQLQKTPLGSPPTPKSTNEIPRPKSS